MAKRKVGSLEVSVAGLGCNNFGMRIDEDAHKPWSTPPSTPAINNFDTADIYGDGQVRGVPRPALGQPPGRRRDHHQGRGMRVARGRAAGARRGHAGHRRQPARGCGTDYVDLYLLHMPDPEDARSARRSARSPSSSPRARCGRSAARTSPREQLEDGRRGGQGLGVPRFVNVQNNYSLLDRARRSRRAPRVRAARHHAHALLPARERRAHRQVPRGEAPPEGTRLAAWGDRGRGDARRREAGRRSSACTAYAKRHGHTLPELALSWLAGAPDGRERDRRRDDARAGAGQRGRHAARGS